MGTTYIVEQWNVRFKKKKKTMMMITIMMIVSRTRAKEALTAGAYPSFCSMNQLRVLLLPPQWDSSPSQGYRQQYVAGTHLYTWVERDKVG